MDTSEINRVVVWRSGMLAGAETFIRDQGLALRRWQPVFAGATRVESPLARDDDVIAFADDPGEFLRLRLTGRSARLHQLMGNLAPDLVHAHFAGDAWLVSRAAAAAGAPLIVTVHGHDVTRQPLAAGLRGVRYRRKLSTVFRRAALILAVSGPIRSRALGWCGVDPEKVRVHHTGVAIPALQDAPRRWDVTFVGRFVDKKGADDLVEALAALADLRPRVLFVGDGPLAETTRRHARRLRLDATFLGTQEHAAVGQALAATRILAAPSRTAADGDTEGLPTTILEASARGVPVVSTRHSGIPEAVMHETTGLLGPERDPVALAAHLRRLLTNEDLRQRLGRQAREHVRRHFDLDRQTRLLEEMYDEVSTARATRRSHRAGPLVPRPRTPAPPERGPWR
ncbi:glycosyltransferase [Krasilnikovia sp. MM14-A1259]|uniref:glycosyltransferase n=1 Tax=Krasilnikovia sp. MM14-A1259 TaxID=3373539 RepID=UPI00381403DF